MIDSRRLKADENLWLKRLSNRLGAKDYLQVNAEALRQGKGAWIQAYLNAITLANVWAIREAMKMRKVREELTLDQVLIESGYAARWEAMGKKSEALAIAQNMINLGLPLDTVVSATRLDPEKVRELYQGAGG